MLCCCTVKLTKTYKTNLFMTWIKVFWLIMLPFSSLDQIIPTLKCYVNRNKWSLFVWTIDLDLFLTCLVNHNLALGHVLRYWITKFYLGQLCINANRWILVNFFEDLQLQFTGSYGFWLSICFFVSKWINIWNLDIIDDTTAFLLGVIIGYCINFQTTI